jgi:quercetin dioxygenase-like cupin family protein
LTQGDFFDERQAFKNARLRRPRRPRLRRCGRCRRCAGPLPPAAQQITPAGAQPSEAGPAEFFTGRVRIDRVWPADENINAAGALVTFEPGTRSAWHTHPAGQRLYVVSGVGLTQERGKPVQVIRPGDAPNVRHWHGATPTTAMTHLAVTGTLQGSNVNWMEKVSDEQYNAR